MYCLIYFDTEDFFSPPGFPVHRLPGQMAETMTKHGLPGCFHIHGEKARFMERHGQTDVIDAIRKHDVSLHYDRGSMHPTTAEEVSELDWFRGVDRVLYREVCGFRDMERIFGKCSAITQHGGTFAAPIVYAAGKLGKPFFYSPFRLPGREVVWFCGNLLFGGARFRPPWPSVVFDTAYRDTAQFEQKLAMVDGYLAERAKAYDLTCMFGCHPVITMMQRFPDALNFSEGADPPPEEWKPPIPVEGVSIPLILENFERLVVKLVGQPNVEWTDVAGITERYRQCPTRVSDEELLSGARAVVEHRGPTYTSTLSAAEILVLLAQRVTAPAASYPVPQIMGPVDEAERVVRDVPADAVDVGQIAKEVTEASFATGYLPPAFSAANSHIAPELALLVLACHATGSPLPDPDDRQLPLDTMPGVAEAIENVKRYRDWCCHGPRYHQPGIVEPFRRQCWTLKPAFTPDEYGPGVELGVGLAPIG